MRDQRLCKTVQKSVSKFGVRVSMLRRPIVAAIDEHDIPFHAKVMRTAWKIRNRKKKGIVKFNRIITISCVVDGQRIVLAAEVVRSKKEQAAAVRRLLKQCRDCGIRMSSVLMDRGYYATDVMATVREAGIPILMPAVKYETVKEAIRKFDAGELDAVSVQTVSSGEQSESFRLVILRRQRGERGVSAEAGALHKMYEEQVRVEGEYCVFATTMADSWIDEDPKRVAEHYKLRWGIENAYKSCDKLYEQLRPWTTSNKMSTLSAVVHSVRDVQSVGGGTLHHRQADRYRRWSLANATASLCVIHAGSAERPCQVRQTARLSTPVISGGSIRYDTRRSRFPFCPSGCPCCTRPAMPGRVRRCCAYVRRQHRRSLPVSYGRHACLTALQCPILNTLACP